MGIVRSADGTLRSVQGLPFNLIVSDLPAESADAASFSNFGGLVSKRGVIRLLGPDFRPVFEYNSQEAAPLLSMDADLKTALVWLPSQTALLHWDGDKFAIFPVDPALIDGTVTDLQLAGVKQVRLLITRPDDSVSAVTISLRSGAFVSSENIPGVRGPAFGQSVFYVYADQKELVVDDARGYRRGIPLPASDLVIERMSSNWLHLSSAKLKQDWTLHVTQAELELSILPALAPTAQPLPIASAAPEAK